MVVTNPPYDGSLHLDFLNMGLDALKEKGKMVIIEPATWLINVKKDGTHAHKANQVKDKIKGHVKSVKIENLNKDFKIALHVPLSITTIDFSKTYDTIEFECCGEKKIVKDIYDCNLIGDYKTIWSILNKVLAYGDTMKNHTTKENKGEGMWYAKYAGVAGGAGGCFCAISSPANGSSYESQATWCSTSNGDYVTGYTSTAYHYFMNAISPKPLCSYSKGRKPTDKIADNIYGTKQELENWKHFIFSNKLPLFINIVLTIHECNVVTSFLPWLVDKKYTDEEINQKFGFTKKEIALIDATLKKFERNSPWFKRYACGPDADSTMKSIDAEVADIVKGA